MSDHASGPGRPPPAAGADWGALRPARACRWSEDAEGVTLLVPRFGQGWLGRVIDRFFHLGPLKLRLDAVGSFVWKRCDGSATVSEISTAMRDELGEKVEPVEDRLVEFLTRLLRGGLASV